MQSSRCEFVELMTLFAFVKLGGCTAYNMTRRCKPDVCHILLCPTSFLSSDSVFSQTGKPCRQRYFRVENGDFLSYNYELVIETMFVIYFSASNISCRFHAHIVRMGYESLNCCSLRMGRHCRGLLAIRCILLWLGARIISHSAFRFYGESFWIHHAYWVTSGFRRCTNFMTSHSPFYNCPRVVQDCRSYRILHANERHIPGYSGPHLRLLKRGIFLRLSQRIRHHR
ncbi:hypothetical protein IW261DRAFT_648773 [Armillaria novae-zelandiae]|uniref:Secreted protein n=1 Tax=Armillaria novae-zelandiae TaxID=153914 RepID=A0AA39PNZ6_9AGAR|nr:hypothetical protein IW261DRAFT_648773 [Armillaria novae-zelandiae]